MKVFSILFSVLILGSFVFSSCKDTVTYAEQLQAEQELIADYIERNNIQVVTELPTDSVWPDSVYYLSETGLYFHLVSRGDTASVIEENDQVVPRFIQYTLDVNADTISNLNTVDFPYPEVFKYMDKSQACVAWHEAVSYMKYNSSKAKFIVYSKIGFEGDEVIPYGFDFNIKFQK